MNSCCSAIIDACLNARSESFPAFDQCNKPKTGCIANIMRSARLKYHLAVKQAKQHAVEGSNRALVNKMASKTYKEFWSDIKHMSKMPNLVTNIMGGKHGEDNITYYVLF